MKIKISTKLISDLKSRALNVRRNIIIASAKAGSVHIASALSPVDVLVTLYFDTLRANPKDTQNPNRDRFILSKGHGGLGLYCVLAERGFISNKLLDRYGQDDSILTVHPVWGSAPGIEATTGSLGHGLGMGLGMALSQKRDKKPGRSFVMLSDGECDEGSTWESVMLAGHLGLDNLVAIVDYNKLQCYGRVKEILDLEPFASKWRANKWEVVEVDGHKFDQLVPVLRKIPLRKGKPTVIIAHTVRGKGLPFIENTIEGYYVNIKQGDLEKTLAEVY